MPERIHASATLTSKIKEHTAIWVVALLGVSLSALVLGIVEHELQAHRDLELQWVAHNRIEAFKQGLQNGLNAVEAVRDLIQASRQLSSDDFATFAHSVMDRYRGIQALRWVPRVTDAQRSAFEIPILERAADGRLVVARPRDTYFPVLYAASPRDDAGYQGYDMASDATSRAVVQRARDTGRMAVSERISLFNEGNDQYGFLAVLPIYRRGTPTGSLAQRRENLMGLAVGVFQLEDLARAAVASLEPRGVDMLVRDESAPKEERFLHVYVSRLSAESGATGVPPNMFTVDPESPLRSEFPVADRVWSVTCAPTPQFRSAIAFQSSQWAVLGVGLSFTFLVSLYLIVNKRRLLDRLRLEKIIREREELFWQMTETVDDTFWAFDIKDGKFVYVSPGYEALWGDSCEHLYADPDAYAAAIHPEDRRHRLHALARTQGGLPTEVVYRVNRPDGTTRWIRDCSFPVSDPHGQVHRLVGVAEDITERWLADRALQESEDKLRTLFNHSPDIIATVDQKGQILILNRSIPGLPKRQAAGQDSAALLPEEFRPWYKRSLRKVFKKQKIRHLRYPKSDGTWWEVRLVPLRQDDGVTTAMLLATDVTENQSLQEQMLHHAQLASVGVLAAGVAHEINNPNNAIRFNASLFNRVWQDIMPILEEYYEQNGDFSLGGLSFEEAKDTLSRLMGDIGSNAERIKRIVENLKHLVRQDAGDLTEDVDIPNVLQNVAMVLHNKVQRYTDRFDVDVQEELPVVKGNSQQLEQVFINLLLNALQSLPGRDASVWLRAGFDAREKVIRVVVRDQGKGIPAEHLAHLTEPFYTTRGQEGGTGLGLSVSSTIIDRHGGKMRFDSQPGTGTTVTVELPISEG